MIASTQTTSNEIFAFIAEKTIEKITQNRKDNRNC